MRRPRSRSGRSSRSVTPLTLQVTAARRNDTRRASNILGASAEISLLRALASRISRSSSARSPACTSSSQSPSISFFCIAFFSKSQVLIALLESSRLNARAISGLRTAPSLESPRPPPLVVTWPEVILAEHGRNLYPCGLAYGNPCLHAPRRPASSPPPRTYRGAIPDPRGRFSDGPFHCGGNPERRRMPGDGPRRISVGNARSAARPGGPRGPVHAVRKPSVDSGRRRPARIAQAEQASLCRGGGPAPSRASLARGNRLAGSHGSLHGAAFRVPRHDELSGEGLPQRSALPVFARADRNPSSLLGHSRAPALADRRYLGARQPFLHATREIHPCQPRGPRAGPGPTLPRGRVRRRPASGNDRRLRPAVVPKARPFAARSRRRPPTLHASRAARLAAMSLWPGGRVCYNNSDVRPIGTWTMIS